MCSFQISIKLYIYILLIASFSTNHGQHANASEPNHVSYSLDCNHCPRGANNKTCSNHGQCHCPKIDRKSSCRCDKEWVGDACQYELRELTCENLRACVQCHVHGTGPLADDNDCEVFCKQYPRPFVMKKLFFSRDELFCSFIDSSNSTDCRFFFKLGNLGTFPLAEDPLEQNIFNFADDYRKDQVPNTDVYVVAKKDKDCKLDSGSRNPFPQSSEGISKWKVLTNDDVMEYLLDDKENGSEKIEESQNSYTTLMILFIFIALPFVTCIISCFANISSLPCGLCNIFRRPSSSYLRNLRPYPGAIVISSPSEDLVLDSIQYVFRLLVLLTVLPDNLMYLGLKMRQDLEKAHFAI